MALSSSLKMVRAFVWFVIGRPNDYVNDYVNVCVLTQLASSGTASGRHPLSTKQLDLHSRAQTLLQGKRAHIAIVIDRPNDCVNDCVFAQARQRNSCRNRGFGGGVRRPLENEDDYTIFDWDCEQAFW